MKEQVQMATLGDCGVQIYSGQIMSRLTAGESSGNEVTVVRRVVVPKCIRADGSIDSDELPEEQLHTDADPKRLTACGDIVMKLSTPYDAAMVGEEDVGCIVPSFCAIIKSSGVLNADYLLAFLNSSTCKSQIKVLVAGAAMAMLSVGKIKSIRIPVPEPQIQHAIGGTFMETQHRLYILDQIMRLEQKKNNVYFRDLVNQYGK